ncbi:PREDICTED: putative ALA-interacting subunit 2 [Nelumbo nucifera]|uniref:ALA-interacting subunit 2 n=1 Tax=Nelumbo nucifera TaxID=4432 RepID=A0A1U8Q2B3_NELNU|nr:PREDICTED: putative ALA-interacting subunit 2 [Nelumbo nucifera]
MDVDGSGGEAQSITALSRRQKALYQFTQQSLPACKPVLTPSWVITTFLLMGIIFIPVGFIAIHASRSVIEIVERYDTECVPEEFRDNKVAYIKDESISKNCTRYFRPLRAYSRRKSPTTFADLAG